MSPDNVRAPGVSRGRVMARAFELAVLLALPLVLVRYLVPLPGEVRVWPLVLSMLPALLALRYGTLAAVLGITVALAALWFRIGPVALAANAWLLVVPFALAVITGLFRDWTRRQKEWLLAEAREQGQKLEQLTRSHAILRTSHARLEARLAERSSSLEGAVRDTARKVAQCELPEAARAVLDLLVREAGVRAATLTMARAGRLSRLPDAQVGNLPPGERNLRGIRRAFVQGSLVKHDRYVVAPGNVEAEPLFALPLVTTSARVVGVVAIYDLPFAAFHDEHARLLATLLSPFVDALLAKVDRGADRPSTPAPLPLPTLALARMNERAELVAAMDCEDVHPDELTDLTDGDPSVPLLLWTVRVDPAQKRVDGAGLHPESALPGEADDQTLAAEEERLGASAEAEARQGGDLVLEGVFEGDHVAGVDVVVAVDGQLEHGAVGIEEEVACALGGEQDEAVAGEEPTRALPVRAELDALAVREVGAALHEQASAREAMVDDVARGAGREHDLAGALGGEGVEHEALPREHALDAAEQAATERGA
jgi:hypothetical protein